MFDSLEYKIKKQNELLQQILDKGGLQIVLEDIEPVIPKNFMSLGRINHIANMCYAVIVILFIAAMVAIFLIGSKLI